MVASTAEKQLSPCKVNTCQLNVHTLSLAVQSVFEIAFKIVQNKEYHDCKGVCYFIFLAWGFKASVEQYIEGDVEINCGART